MSRKSEISVEPPPDDRLLSALEPPPGRFDDVPLALLEVQMIEAYHAWQKLQWPRRWKYDPQEKAAMMRARLAYQDAVAALCEGINRQALFYQVKALIADTTQKNRDSAAVAVKAGAALAFQTDWLTACASRARAAALRLLKATGERVSCTVTSSLESDLTVTVFGEVDTGNAQFFGTLLREKVLDKDSAGLVTVDLRFLDFMDTSGVAVLVSVHQLLAQAGRKMTLLFHPACRSSQILRMVKVTRQMLRSE